ncbi:MAG: DegT/DnrJ/EryC1/StrS family aminotransferase, partial [Cyanobacteriota bacterium]|nr:DegT/DnrJ/EryC1/StrS family aminotransferase [Cyanobacteriota bacterium]
MTWAGQFVVITWPDSDPTTRKRHPALVLNEPDDHGDLQVLKVTSRSPREPHVEVTDADLVEGKLKRVSRIRLHHRMVVHQTLVKPVGVQLASPKLAEVHRALALGSARQFSRLQHGSFRPAADPDRVPWREGDTIPYAGRVFTEEEVEAAVASTLDFWLTLGKEGEAFQQELAAFLGVRHSLLVNSGSSANLIAIAALTSPKLPKAR